MAISFALLRSEGVLKVKINKYRVGVFSTEEETKAIDWQNFLESIALLPESLTDEDKIKQLGSFFAGIGVIGNEPTDVQTNKVIAALEKIALMVAEQYGEDRWGEYSVIFSRILSALSPSIKKNIIKYKSENKKLSNLFRSLLPTMSDEDIIDIIGTKVKEKTPATEDEIVEMLKNITGTRLPDILSMVRVNFPELNFEKVASKLMAELKTVKGQEVADKFKLKNLETEMRSFFPKLRAESAEIRKYAIDDLISLSGRLFEAEVYDLIQLLIDRLDSMTDTEEDMTVFRRILAGMKTIYL